MMTSPRPARRHLLVPCVALAAAASWSALVLEPARDAPKRELDPEDVSLAASGRPPPTPVSPATDPPPSAARMPAAFAQPASPALADATKDGDDERSVRGRGAPARVGAEPVLAPVATRATSRPRVEPFPAAVQVIDGSEHVRVQNEPEPEPEPATLEEAASAMAPAQPLRAPLLPATITRDELDERWRGETADPQWTDEIARYLHETAAAAGLEPSIVEATDCTTTLCRVQLRFDDLKSAATFQELAQNPDIEYRGEPAPDGEGVGVVLYVARPRDPS